MAKICDKANKSAVDRRPGGVPLKLRLKEEGSVSQVGELDRVEQGLRQGHSKGIMMSFYERLVKSKGIKPRLTVVPWSGVHVSDR